METSKPLRACLECEEELQGRSDKKFCDDACRTAYNNKKKARTSLYLRKVNRVLARNYKILCQLNPKGKTRLAREQLLQRGFNFNFFTNLYETQSGTRYFFVYEQGYLLLPEDQVALVRQKDYLKERLL